MTQQDDVIMPIIPSKMVRPIHNFGIWKQKQVFDMCGSPIR